MNKTAKNILTGVGIGVVGAAGLRVAHRYVSKYLMKIAVHRDLPKKVERQKEKMASTVGASEVTAGVLDAAKALENGDLEVVEIESYDGLHLVGHWYCPENPKRVIVAMHGWRSSWSQDFGVIAPFWQGNDCAVLYAEQRGQGNSGGEYMGFGLLERYDCLNWAKWVSEKTENKLPIYLGGISMGAATVMMTAGLELPEIVKGIVADCGFTSPYAIWKHVVESNFRIPYGIYSAAAKDLCSKKIQAGPADYSCTDALKNCKVPVLFIHGTDDDFVPVEMTYENYKACNAPKYLLIVPGAEHGMSYIVDKAGYEKAVIKFWNQYDNGSDLSE